MQASYPKIPSIITPIIFNVATAEQNVYGYSSLIALGFSSSKRINLKEKAEWTDYNLSDGARELVSRIIKWVSL